MTAITKSQLVVNRPQVLLQTQFIKIVAVTQNAKLKLVFEHASSGDNLFDMAYERIMLKRVALAN